jgi:catechol 2,3-dioxygenase-like lactoylglutathione lyase family enzyme
MVIRMGHMALRVHDLDASVQFHQEILGMVETERSACVSYLTCNERHHELMLIQDPVRRGYDHIALEVADAADLETASARVRNAGGEVVGSVYDGEPGIDRAVRVLAPGGHVFKLFCGMETVPAPAAGDRPLKFEHASVKAWNMKALERFLEAGLGFGFSDRMGRTASWWHCNEDHHGMAIVRAPRSELSHYAFTMEDFNAMGRAADRLRLHRDQRLIYGPSRHGPGNNQFMYFHDHDKAMVELCADMAMMSDYEPRQWPGGFGSINQWGPPPPPRFILTGFPVVTPDWERPTYAMRPDRTPAAARL